jgi:hypothetical protein
LKPGEYSQTGLTLPTKIKNIQYRGAAASLPYSGKYGIVSFGNDYDDEPTRLLVGPEYLAEARLADKGIESDDDEFSGSEKVDFDDTNKNAQETEILKRPDVLEEEQKDIDKNNFEESFENVQSPYGIPNSGRYPLFPVTYDRFNYLQQNPYFLPPNSYVPIPIVNQYLQRRSYNPAAQRYPQVMSPYFRYYGNEQYNPTNTFAPVRFLYAQ